MKGFSLSWFMLDLDNFQLITSPHCIPSDIQDTKEIFLAETPIPGLNYRPITYGGGGNRKLSFTLPLIKRDQNIGNLLVLKQFDMLRNQSTGITKILSGQFTPTPKVLFQYGTGSVPLVYWIKKCDAIHKQGWVNKFGFPMYSEIQFELWLDETNPLYIMEEIFRKISATLGMLQQINQISKSNKKPL